MEGLFCLSGSVLAFSATFVLLGPGVSGVTQRRARQRLWARRALRELLIALGGTWLVSELLRLPSWDFAAGELARVASASMGPITREQGCALLLLLGLAPVLLMRSPVALLLASPCLALSVSIWHSSWMRSRARRLSREMPGVFRALSMAIGSGETLQQSIEYLGAHFEGPVSEAFSAAALRLRCGESIESAMGCLRRELDAPGTALLSTALVISQRTGSPLKRLFEHAARLVERQGEFERLLAVKTAQVRLSVRIVSLLPALLIAALSVLSADFRAGLASPTGSACVLVAAGMDLLALAIIRRQMKGVL